MTAMGRHGNAWMSDEAGQHRAVVLSSRVTVTAPCSSAGENVLARAITSSLFFC